MTTDPRKNKGGGATTIANLSRTGRSATVKRSVKSPSPPEPDQHEDTQEGSNGLVISNRNNIGNFMEEDEELGMLADGEMDSLKKEEDNTLSLLIDSRLLHKDFIVDKFSLALVCFRKVSSICLPVALGYADCMPSSFGSTHPCL